MKKPTFQNLKDQVDTLEKSLLAITSINEIQMENQSNGNPVLSPEHTAYLLDYLMEPTMYQVEALRVAIHALAKAEAEQLASQAVPA